MKLSELVRRVFKARVRNYTVSHHYADDKAWAVPDGEDSSSYIAAVHCPECGRRVVVYHGDVVTCGNHNLQAWGNRLEVWNKRRPPFPLTVEERERMARDREIEERYARAGDYVGLARYIQHRYGRVG